VGVNDADTKHLLFICEDIIENLPSLERNNGWTTSVFHILLTAQGRSGLRE